MKLSLQLANYLPQSAKIVVIVPGGEPNVCCAACWKGMREYNNANNNSQVQHCVVLASITGLKIIAIAPGSTRTLFIPFNVPKSFALFQKTLFVPTFLFFVGPWKPPIAGGVVLCSHQEGSVLPAQLGRFIHGKTCQWILC